MPNTAAGFNLLLKPAKSGWPGPLRKHPPLARTPCGVRELMWLDVGGGIPSLHTVTVHVYLISAFCNDLRTWPALMRFFGNKRGLSR